MADDWNEPDEEVLTQLTRFGCFGADSAVIDSAGLTSSVPAPDGSPQGLTAAEKTTIAVRGALRLLLANGLIESRLPDGDVMVRMDAPR